MISHARAKDTKLLGDPRACFPGKNLNFEILKLLEMHQNCQSYSTTTTLFCIILNLQSHQEDLFGSWGVPAQSADHPAYRPGSELSFQVCLTACILGQ